MKKILSILCILSFICSQSLKADEYLKIVSLESNMGSRATFISAGIGHDKKAYEANAIKSLFYTLFFQGVDGVNDGKPLVVCPNEDYTNSFFNIEERYKPYFVEKDDYVKATKSNDRMQGTLKVTIRLQQLINDVRRNTKCPDAPKVNGGARVTEAKPTVIVVPYKKSGESYKSILENDFDKRTAVEEVKKGFNNAGIRTMDLLSHIEQVIRRGQYEENAGAADSNDKELLLSSNADVYVVVDVKKETKTNGSRVSLILHAHDVATNADWGSQTGGSKNFYSSADLAALCRYAVEDNINPFLKQILKYYAEPTRVSLQISLLDDPNSNIMTSLQDPECKNGDSVADFLTYWLDENAYGGDYHMQGVVDEEVIFDYIMIPKTDEKGRKMNPFKFMSNLKRALKTEGIESTTRLEGGTMIITVSKNIE